VTHSQCDARHTVTFSATEHHRPLTGTKLYCLVNRDTCVWTTCLAVHRAGVKPATSRLQVQHTTVTPPLDTKHRRMITISRKHCITGWVAFCLISFHVVYLH